MEQATMTSKGQLTIPASLRNGLELKSGDKVNCYVEGNRLVIVPAKGSLKRLKGIVPPPEKAVSVEDMTAACALEAAKRHQSK